jgi:large subunit ribosomal protein L15
MPTRLRKCRKFRGSHTHGWGSKKKHRGGGSQGGKGHSGMMKHKKSLMLKECPDHFGNVGFKVPKKSAVKVITLKDIDILAKKIGKREINLSEYGYQKVLSTGRITQPLKITAEKIVEKAKEKIIGSGGEAIEGN